MVRVISQFKYNAGLLHKRKIHLKKIPLICIIKG